MTSARHRSFIALRMGGGLAVLSGVPVYLAIRGAPSMIEVMILAWAISPILISYFLSRTGRFEVAQILSDTLDATPRPSILELEGLGKEIWEGIDPAAHIEAERRSWD